jgi:hypothetical protein
MQLQTIHRPQDGLAFTNVAPRETSTRHVAAAAFYHCLGELQNLVGEMGGLRSWQYSQQKVHCASISWEHMGKL